MFWQPNSRISKVEFMRDCNSSGICAASTPSGYSLSSSTKHSKMCSSEDTFYFSASLTSSPVLPVSPLPLSVSDDSPSESVVRELSFSEGRDEPVIDWFNFSFYEYWLNTANGWLCPRSSTFTKSSPIARIRSLSLAKPSSARSSGKVSFGFK